VPERFVSRASFHEEAEKEFFEASRDYGSESDKVSEEFEAEVERCLALILEHPRMAPAMGRKHVRGKLLRRFPHIIIYAIEPNQVRILAVAHQSRRPGYWADRL
jgi:plasmid stabilization system protein ParE